MNNGLIFNLLNTIIRKEKEGNTLTPFQFSELLQMCSLEKANGDYAYYEHGQVITDSLRSLMDSINLSLTSGTGNFVAAIQSANKTYWHIIGVNTTYATVERLTSLQFDDFKYSDLLMPTTSYPVCKISGNNIYVLPNSILSVEFLFLKEPAIPFYDYYIDVNDHYVYMSPGTTHKLLSGEEYRDGTVIGTVSSISVELSYPSHERFHVLYMMLSKLGISLSRQDVAQYGLMREQKEQSE